MAPRGKKAASPTAPSVIGVISARRFSTWWASALVARWCSGARSSGWRWPTRSRASRLHRRHGGVSQRPFHQPHAPQPRTRAADHSGDLREAFIKGQKNDYNDAEAIAEAALRPNLRTVREKTQDELDLQAYHRIRSRLVSRRTATINQIRAFLIEQGIAVRTGVNALRKSLFEILKHRHDELSARMVELIVDLYEDWEGLDERIDQLTSEIEKIAATEPNCRLLMSVPGVGPIISTAVAAAIGDGEAFERGRDFGAWLGLVPRQYSTGGRSILGRISKRGNKYLRMLFIQAAKVLLMRPQHWERFSFGAWLKQAAPRMHRNKLATALANKLARISWSVLQHQRPFNTHLQELPAI